MEHSADLSMAPANSSPKEKQESSLRCNQIKTFIKTLRSAMHNTFRYGEGEGGREISTNALLSLIGRIIMCRVLSRCDVMHLLSSVM